MIWSFETPRGMIELRELRNMDEMEAAEQIQLDVWGSDARPHPKEILIPIQHEGGLLAGAFSPDQMLVGLVFSFPTRDSSVHHSQLLATLEEWRGNKIGTQLKWFQREWCLDHPLRTANAELNIRHLGGCCNTYCVNYYGQMRGIDAGTPTDRLLMEWHLNSPRVQARAKQFPVDQGFPFAESANEIIEGRPGRVRLNLNSAQILIRLPRGYIEMSRSQPGLAMQWRMNTRELFLNYFDQGYFIKEFTQLEEPAYLLERGTLNGL
jgi:chorismate synthase